MPPAIRSEIQQAVDLKVSQHKSDTAPTNKIYHRASSQQKKDMQRWDLKRACGPVREQPAISARRRLIDSLSSLEALKRHMYFCVSGLSLLI